MHGDSSVACGFVFLADRIKTGVICVSSGEKKEKKERKKKKTPFRDCRGKEGRKGGGYCLEGYVLFIRLFSSSIDVRIFIHA